MKFVPYLLVISLFVFSCNEDGDSNRSEYKSGWTDEVIVKFAEECENITQDFDTCLCGAKETAKLYSLSQVLNGLTESQQETVSMVSIEKCGVESFN